eukprot:UN00376
MIVYSLRNVVLDYILTTRHVQAKTIHVQGKTMDMQGNNASSTENSTIKN